LANGSSRLSAAQADTRPEGLARPLVAVGKDQHTATGESLWRAFFGVAPKDYSTQ
jgi:hypothetical protein